MTAPIAITFLRDKDHGGDAGQPRAIARQLAGFIETASTSLDIAIYDFRLSDALAAGIVDALIAAADRGVVVRIGYDAGKPVAGTAADFLALQADPAPVGTATWVTGHFVGTAVQTKAIHAGSHLMHSKYVLRDAGVESAAVWTGSTNFTDDAWTLQENNVITVTSQAVAAAYRIDFDAMWTAGSITHTGAGDSGTTEIDTGGIDTGGIDTGGTDTARVAWDFAPGDGAAIDSGLVAAITAASSRIVVAAMVLSSHTVLAALTAALTRGIPISGIYDAGQMDPIVRNTWTPNPHAAAVLADWRTVSALLVPKHSTPYTPTGPHDFMHNKVLVCDDTVATGSYNFSANAEKNAENQLRITDPGIAGQYADYITTIAQAYSGLP